MDGRWETPQTGGRIDGRFSHKTDGVRREVVPQTDGFRWEVAPQTDGVRREVALQIDGGRREFHTPPPPLF